MMFDWLAASIVTLKDLVSSKIKAGDILGEPVLHGGQTIFPGGRHTALKFPPKAESGEARQAQEMNYEYFIQTMAGLMKKYAPEILK